MKKFFTRLVIVLALVTFMPLVSSADERQADEGTVKITILDNSRQTVNGRWFLHQRGLNGMIIRNGISDEEFFMEEGNYYLEVWSNEKMKAFEIDIDAMQFLEAGETVDYTIYYYADEEEKALGHITPLSSEEAGFVEEEIVEEEATEEEEVVAEEASEDERPTVPTFETAPAVATVVESEPLIAVPQLAATGAPIAILLLPSVLGGLWITRRKKMA